MGCSGILIHTKTLRLNKNQYKGDADTKGSFTGTKSQAPKKWTQFT
jgi:hypothetical protein